jgi:hypothetical protein
MNYTLKIILSISIIILLQNKAVAQEKSIYMYGEESKPTIFIICKPQEKENILININKVTIQNELKFHYVFITDEITSSKQISININKLLNSQLWFDQYHLYLFHYGDTNAFATYKSLDKKVFAETHFQIDSENMDVGLWNNIITKFRKKYLWAIDLEKIEEKGKREIFQKKNFSLGVAMGWNWQNSFKQDSNYLPSFITKYGVLLDYKLSDHFHLNGKILMSFSIPNQEKLQSEMQSQIDPSKGGSQRISAELSMHIFIQPTLQFNYFYNLKKSWQSFAGIGVSVVNFSAARKKISRTIDISSGGMGNIGNAGLNGIDDLELNTGKSINPFIAFGVSKNISRNTSFYVSGDYFFHTTNKTHKGVTPSNDLQNLSIQTGIMFRLGKKEKYTYQYLNF